MTGGFLVANISLPIQLKLVLAPDNDLILSSVGLMGKTVS